MIKDAKKNLRNFFSLNQTRPEPVAVAPAPCYMGNRSRRETAKETLPALSLSHLRDLHISLRATSFAKASTVVARIVSPILQKQESKSSSLSHPNITVDTDLIELIQMWHCLWCAVPTGRERPQLRGWCCDGFVTSAARDAKVSEPMPLLTLLKATPRP